MPDKKTDDRRGAQRFPVPKPVPATYGGFAVKILEVSLIGSQIAHTDRITPRSRLPLRFKWRGSEVRIEATLARSEMRSVGGKPAYVSGLEFCQSADQSPAVMREIVEFLAKSAAPPPSPPQPQPATDDAEIESVSADYLQCTWNGGRWTKVYVGDPAQPREGFTIVAPANEAEADVLCRAYERADAATRKAMRARFESAIAQKRRG